jgi:SPP1 family predicted phage head-tail adaptor
MLSAGALDKRVTFRTRAPGEDGLGQPNGAWSTVDELWARVVPLRGREWLAAGQTHMEVTHRIVIRHHAALAALLEARAPLQALRGSLVYEVVHGMPSERDGAALEFMCKQLLPVPEGGA